MSQEAFFEDDRKTPERIVSEALEAEGPVCRTFCLLSGGHDSTTCAHRTRDLYDELAFIDTGTALPGVRDFVHEFAQWIDKPLRVFDAGRAYVDLVLGDARWWAYFQAEANPGEGVAQFVVRTAPLRKRGDGHGAAPQGFPGPGRKGHLAAYTVLKERQVERLIRETKATHAPGDRMARVALLSGARKHESRRRGMGHVEDSKRRNAQVWINPLNYWPNDEADAYRREHAIPESDVAALLHRSGECNCAAYMAAGELADVKRLYPDWHAATIAPLEAEARAIGVPRYIWGERTDSGRPGAKGFQFLPGVTAEQIELNFGETAETGEELCSTCVLRSAA